MTHTGDTVTREISPSSDEFKYLRQRLHRRALDNLDIEPGLLVNDQRTLTDHLERQLDILLTHHGRTLSGESRTPLLRTVRDEIQGMGPIAGLMLDARVSDILINGYDDIWADRNGRLERTGLTFDNNDHLLRFLNRTLGQQGRHVDLGNPIVDARLNDGSRLNAVIAPPSPKGPVISIRCFRLSPLSHQEMIQQGFMTLPMWDYLGNAVHRGANLVIAGGSSAGKTSLLNLLSMHAENNERIITIEETQELRLDHPHVVSLEARLGNSEGLGAVTLTDLLKAALRMRADRIIIGEVRGSEVFDMLQAMNVGHNGSMTTVHANGPGDVLTRLEYLGLTGRPDFPSTLIRQLIGSAIDIIVYLERSREGHRRIASIAELSHSGDRVELVTRFQQPVGPCTGKSASDTSWALTGRAAPEADHDR